MPPIHRGTPFPWTRNLLTRTVVAGVIVEELKPLKLHPSVVSEEQRLKIVCVGALTDDAASGCGGTLARYSPLGHTVTIIYLTRGESGIQDRSHEEAAAVRSAESVRR